MRLPQKWTWIVACAVLGYAASPAVAQTQQGPDFNVGPGNQINPSPPGVANLTLQQNVNLTPDQRLSQANAIVTASSHAHDQVQRKLQQARQQRDVVKVLCLNDKLNQIDVTTRSLQERFKTLQSATAAYNQAQANGDPELARHEFTIISVMNQRIQQLLYESNQCIGAEASFLGATAVFTSVDPNMPGGDVTGFGPIGGVDIPAPPTEVGPGLYSPPPPPCSPAK